MSIRNERGQFIMNDIFYYIRELYPKNTPFVICTIFKKQGSTPRKEGAAMIVNDSGLVYGTIGGGAIEHEAILQAKKIMNSRQNSDEKYILTKNDARDIGMVCGGMNFVHFEYVKDNRCFLQLNPRSTSYIAYHLFRDIPFELFYEKRWLTDNPLDLTLEQCQKNNHSVLSVEENEVFVTKLFDSSRAYLFGGGHVSRAVSNILDFLNFEVHIVENRKEFLNESDFPKGARLHLLDYEHLESLDIRPSDYCCVLTRGHASDGAVVRQLIAKQPKYLGVIGSKRKSLLLFKQLQEEGFEKEEIQQIHAPIGIEIGAETPEEIAISIASQIIQIRNEVNL